ncbi:MAG: hypothetical protein HY811_03555 [Planctomycetes bacterium]|nr:hypothetical protein [Planctomycetota bacterium]
MEGFFIIFLIVGAIGITILVFYFEAKRRKEMMSLAEELGLTYMQSTYGKDGTYGDISLFTIGDSRRANHIISGNKENCYVDIFYYKYITGSGKNRTTHSNSVCVLTIKEKFDYLFIRTENFLDKFAGAIGFDDIDFESREFSSRFYVKSSDKKFAYDIIHPQMMEFLMNYGKTPAIEIKNSHLAFYMHKTIKPAEYRKLYDFAMEFYKKTPHYVLEEGK